MQQLPEQTAVIRDVQGAEEVGAEVLLHLVVDVCCCHHRLLLAHFLSANIRVKYQPQNTEHCRCGFKGGAESRMTRRICPRGRTARTWAYEVLQEDTRRGKGLCRRGPPTETKVKEKGNQTQLYCLQETNTSPLTCPEYETIQTPDHSSTAFGRRCQGVIFDLHTR